MNDFERTSISVYLPIWLERGRAGLWYATSPLVKGLLVAEPTKELAISNAISAFTALCSAVSKDSTDPAPSAEPSP